MKNFKHETYQNYESSHNRFMVLHWYTWNIAFIHTHAHLYSSIHILILLLSDEPPDRPQKVNVHLRLGSVVKDSTNIDRVKEDEANQREN